MSGRKLDNARNLHYTYVMLSEFSLRLERIEAHLARALSSAMELTTAASAPWKTAAFAAQDACVGSTHLAQLVEPCARLMALGGKRWRPLLLVLCAELAQDAKNSSPQTIETAYALTPLVEFAHTASLIHDDIEDGADTRRGERAAHIVFGTDVAINAASWLYFEATTCIDALALSESERNACYALYLLELRRLHLGQAMDILWHRNPHLFPTQDEYTAMVRNKTGTLARMAVKLGIRCGGGTAEETERAGHIAEDIGVGFQILDDVQNLTTGNPGKKRGDDIVEGKKSLPVLLHLARNPGDRTRLSALFAQARAEGIQSSAVEQAAALLTESGAVADARTRGTQLVASKSRELSALYGTNGAAAQRIIDLLSSISGSPPS